MTELNEAAVCLPDVVHTIMVQSEAVSPIRSIHKQFNVLSNAKDKSVFALNQWSAFTFTDSRQ